jgi:hypothetical protein
MEHLENASIVALRKHIMRVNVKLSRLAQTRICNNDISGVSKERRVTSKLRFYVNRNLMNLTCYHWVVLSIAARLCDIIMAEAFPYAGTSLNLLHSCPFFWLDTEKGIVRIQ